MKQMLIAALLAAGMLPGAMAQNAPAKIAVISFQAAVAQTNEFQRDFADLSKKFDPQRTELSKLVTEIEALNKEIQTQGGKLSEGELARRQKTIEEKQKQAKRLQDDAQNDFQQEMQALANRVATKFGEVMQQYSTEQGFTMVLDVTQTEQSAPVVLWAAPSTDISAKIIEAYNAKSGVPAPAPQAAK